MDKHFIMAVHITNRVKDALRVQSLLTEYGCSIKTRLGLHEASKEVCSPAGMILLELLDEESCAALQAKLEALDGIEIKTIVFDHI